MIIVTAAFLKHC